MKVPVRFLVMACLVSLAIPGCASLRHTDATPAPPASASPALTRETTISPPAAALETPISIEAERQTLASLEQVDDYPLYTMTYFGDYLESSAGKNLRERRIAAAARPAWACSLFAAFGNSDNPIYGRNFDWDYSPALLLFTHPSDGYASVSMVDLAYLVDEPNVRRLIDLPLDERRALLSAPWLPFDGMNAAGVAIGMAAVPSADLPNDPSRQTLDSLEVMREVLDHAGDVDQAVKILQNYNIDWGSGPPLHYLVADRSGRAALFEGSRGEFALLQNQDPWHLATNFTVSQAGEHPERMCPRYRRIQERLSEENGLLSPMQGLELLSEVAQGGPGSSTQWSVIYQMVTGQVYVVMNRRYEAPHTFLFVDNGK